MISLLLPWPPTLNTYWRTPHSGRLAGRTMLSQKARDFREQCRRMIIASGPHKALVGKLLVTIEASPPDNRRRDLDNLLKGTLDALQHCGVIRDDGDIDGLGIVRKGPVKGGMLKVHISTGELP
jgi:crossover junction endodeoxyribonuclease RusA